MDIMKIEKLVTMGDSLTEGYDIDKTKRWTNLLHQKHNLAIVNTGISGDTTTGMIGRFATDVLAHQPSHVFIMGGTNDLWLHISTAQIISNIHAMTRQAKYHGIIPIIGIPTPVFAPKDFSSDTYFVDDFSLSRKMIAFQNELRRYTAEDEKVIIDFSEMNENLMLADGVHPDEEGQKWMMEKAEQVLV